MTPEELFDALILMGLSLEQIEKVCQLSIEEGGNFKKSSMFIIDNILPEILENKQQGL